MDRGQPPKKLREELISVNLTTVSGVLMVFAKGMKREAGALYGAMPALPPQR